MTTSTQTRIEELRNAALNYGRMGFRVIPLFEINQAGFCSCLKGRGCPSPGKHPRTKNGVKDATSDEGSIRQYWQRNPGANIGIATGLGFGCVLDIDPRNGGFASLEKIERDHGPLPATVTSATGGGGSHRIFSYSQIIDKNKINAVPGLDCKTDNGLIVAPPSNHLSGNYYAWEHGKAPGDIALAPMPEHLVHLLTAKTDKTPGPRTEGESFDEGGRNSRLFAQAGRLLRANLSFEAIEVALQEENLQKCKPPLSREEVSSIAKSVMRYSTEEGSWPVIVELPILEPEAPSLSENMLPQAIAPWACDISHRMHVPLEFVAVPLIASLSSALSRRVSIAPKKYDEWFEHPNIWAMLIARPGAMKSPCLSEAINPLARIQNAALSSYAEKMRTFSIEEALMKIQIEALKKPLQKKTVDRETIQSAKIEIEKIEKKLSEERPRLKRLLVNDTTIEKLIELMMDNPNGLLFFRDELYGLLVGLEKKGHEGDRAFLLEAWSGKGSFTSDRIGRGTVNAKHTCLTILGGIQPDRLTQYFDDMLSGSSGDDGLLARFQLMVWPNEMKSYQHVDQAPLLEAKEVVEQLFEKFVNIGTDASTPGSSLKFRFSDEAQIRFNDWISELENRRLSGEITSGPFQAHLSKFRSLMPSLALIFHVAEIISASKTSEVNLCPPVTLAATDLAIAWCRYLELHAAKVYAPVINPQLNAAHAIAALIKSGVIRDSMTVRDIYRFNRSGLTNADLVRDGLEVLSKHHWLRLSELRSPKGGAPSEIIKLNPAVLACGATT